MKNQKISAIIIEDEENAVELLNRYLHNFPKIRVIGDYDNIAQAEKEILYHKPDLLFLDIELRDGSAFDLLHNIQGRKLNFAIIFLTSHKYQRKEAISFCGTRQIFFDYFEKPYSFKDLEEFLNKFCQKLDNRRIGKLLVVTKTETKNIDYEDIVYFKSERNNSLINLFDGRIAQIPKSLIRLEKEDLPNDLFFRISDSFIVNLDKIEALKKNSMTGAKCVVLIKGKQIKLDVSKSKVRELDRIIKGQV